MTTAIVSFRLDLLKWKVVAPGCTGLRSESEAQTEVVDSGAAIRQRNTSTGVRVADVDPPGNKPVCPGDLVEISLVRFVSAGLAFHARDDSTGDAPSNCGSKAEFHVTKNLPLPALVLAAHRCQPGT